MPGLVACPFCREMFEQSEAEVCPECGLPLADITKLKKTDLYEEEEAPLPPDMVRLPFTYVSRARGALIVLALLGLGAFFLPWVREFAPELRELSGLAFARRLSWMWAPFVAWFVMLPIVLTRRTIHAMRGARLAVALLATIVIATVILRVSVVPESTRLRPVRFEWTFGLYATFGLGLIALGVATRFGGRVDDLAASSKPSSSSSSSSSRRPLSTRKHDETLH